MWIYRSTLKTDAFHYLSFECAANCRKKVFQIREPIFEQNAFSQCSTFCGIKSFLIEPCPLNDMHFLVDPFSCVHMILALIGLSCLLTPEEVPNQEKGQISGNPRFDFGRTFLPLIATEESGHSESGDGGPEDQGWPHFVYGGNNTHSSTRRTRTEKNSSQNEMVTSAHYALVGLTCDLRKKDQNSCRPPTINIV